MSGFQSNSLISRFKSIYGDDDIWGCKCILFVETTVIHIKHAPCFLYARVNIYVRKSNLVSIIQNVAKIQKTNNFQNKLSLIGLIQKKASDSVCVCCSTLIFTYRMRSWIRVRQDVVRKHRCFSRELGLRKGPSSNKYLRVHSNRWSDWDFLFRSIGRYVSLLCYFFFFLFTVPCLVVYLYGLCIDRQ